MKTTENSCWVELRMIKQRPVTILFRYIFMEIFAITPFHIGVIDGIIWSDIERALEYENMEVQL